MALTHYFEKCPNCWSTQIYELARMDAGRFDPNDFAIYKCSKCGDEFDYITDPSGAIPVGTTTKE